MCAGALTLLIANDENIYSFITVVGDVVPFTWPPIFPLLVRRRITMELHAG